MKLAMYLLLISILSSNSVFPQSVGINSNGSAPNPSAMLDVESTSKGFLLPRMNSNEIRAISNPAQGLLVYNTEWNKFQYYNGTNWQNMDGTLNLRDRYAGGIIFYLDSTAKHGMICSENDQSSNEIFGSDLACDGQWGFGTGEENTAKIVVANASGASAAKTCVDLSLYGYNDWFLPSVDEMTLICNNLHTLGLGNFDNNATYWTSTDGNVPAWARVFTFYNCASTSRKKNTYSRVRAVRTF